MKRLGLLLGEKKKNGGKEVIMEFALGAIAIVLASVQGTASGCDIECWKFVFRQNNVVI